jgi:hypothetical protein
MAGGNTTVERLRQFLGELSPGARSMLVGELERSVLRGDEVAGADLVLQELRRILREQRKALNFSSSHWSHFSSMIVEITSTRVASRAPRTKALWELGSARSLAGRRQCHGLGCQQSNARQ